MVVIGPDKAAYCNCSDPKTQFKSFLCIPKCNKNPWYSIPKFFIEYDPIVFGLRLPFLHTKQAIVGYKFIDVMVPNLVY